MERNKEKNFISVVLYLYNKEQEISVFLPKLYAMLEDNFLNFELICVNDDSKDQSREVVKKFAEQVRGKAVISLIDMSVYQGREAAINAGVELAIGDYVFEVDYFEKLDGLLDQFMVVYNKAMEGYDIVSLVPENQRWSRSSLFYMLYNQFSKGPRKLYPELFRLASRRAINRMHALGKSIPYRKALYANCGLLQAKIECSMPLSNHLSFEKYEHRNRADTAVDALILFTDAVTKLALFISICFLVVSLLIGIYAFYVYFFGRRPVEGWTPMMLFLSLGFLGVFFVLTIVLKYLSLLINLVFKRRQYLIKGIEKLS